MTGRELIIYILENHLEDKQVFEDGKLLGFMTAMEAATKFEVGLATVYVWANQGELPGVRIGDDLYIYVNAQHPMKENSNV